MKTLFDQNKEILDAWEKVSTIEDGQTFIHDGLINRGRIHHDNGYWMREPGNEEEMWNTCSLKIMYLTKDMPDAGVEDIRYETCRSNNYLDKEVTDFRFGKNLLRTFYGLTHTTADDSVPYNELSLEECLKFYDSYPMVRINCKKTTGDSTLPNSVLNAYLKEFAPYLSKQIMLYDADVIVCCGGSGVIKNFVEEHCYPNLVNVDNQADWMYYCKDSNKLIVNSCHLNPLSSMADEDFYSWMTGAYQMFLKQYPEFNQKVKDIK